ncbi:FHA domain-containing protein [Gilvimarinus sp. DA14]|uniref:FHA domain-containing protein n=1 Tax=Gilvimarinus sp. DA14 TaxID=2956798 RepID=UPI0020B642F5|nr:FHA domain-containing protein [Gilvimarinus sp. DA14]UTF59973.1 FHA domain-containing protein [Gilvimarinus sp. DA14]
MLKLQREDKQQSPIVIVEKLYTLGSAAQNDIVIDAADIDPQHAKLVHTDSQVTLKDNDSQGGCFVNGQRVTQKVLQAGDKLRLGKAEFKVLPLSATDTRLPAVNPGWQLIADGSWLTGQIFTIEPDKRYVIGRASDCDIPIKGSHLSRRHTEVALLGGSLRIRDLNSTNGTFVNEKPISDDLAHHGDHLRVDVYSFRIVNPEREIAAARSRPQLPENNSKAPQATSGPKRWKTKPTSPGNRTEPTYPAQGSRANWIWGGIVTLLLIALAWALLP